MLPVDEGATGHLKVASTTSGAEDGEGGADELFVRVAA
jgi:hypothetical protein